MVIAANEPCKEGWDANQFMYMLSGVFFFEVLLIIIQLRRLKAQLEEYTWIEYLRQLIFLAKVGLFLYGNIGINTNDYVSDCMSLNLMAFIML